MYKNINLVLRFFFLFYFILIYPYKFEFNKKKFNFKENKNIFSKVFAVGISGVFFYQNREIINNIFYSVLKKFFFKVKIEAERIKNEYFEKESKNYLNFERYKELTSDFINDVNEDSFKKDKVNNSGFKKEINISSGSGFIKKGFEKLNKELNFEEKLKNYFGTFKYSFDLENIENIEEQIKNFTENKEFAFIQDKNLILNINKFLAKKFIFNNIYIDSLKESFLYKLDLSYKFTLDEIESNYSIIKDEIIFIISLYGKYKILKDYEIHLNKLKPNFKKGFKFNLKKYKYDTEVYNNLIKDLKKLKKKNLFFNDINKTLDLSKLENSDYILTISRLLFLKIEELIRIEDKLKDIVLLN